MIFKNKVLRLLLGVAVTTGFMIAQAPPGPPDPASPGISRDTRAIATESEDSCQRKQLTRSWTSSTRRRIQRRRQGSPRSLAQQRVLLQRYR